MAFGKKKEEIEKPNKIKIDIKFDKVRDNITDLQLKKTKKLKKNF